MQYDNTCKDEYTNGQWGKKHKRTVGEVCWRRLSGLQASCHSHYQHQSEWTVFSLDRLSLDCLVHC